MRRLARTYGLLVVLYAVAGASAGATAQDRGALGAKRCGDVRVDRFLRPARHGEFGAFDIDAYHSDCRTARRLASRYVHHPPADPRRSQVAGWSCTEVNAGVNQEGYVACRRRASTVAFRDATPNG
jgi:hypothetical protein